MDARAFLGLVVPKEGIKYLAVSTQGGRPAHYRYDYFEPMAEGAIQFNAQAKDVYFALASFNEPQQQTDKDGSLLFHPDGQAKMLKRTAKLARKVKAFWADLDCGEGKPYPDQAAAVADVQRFVEESGAPTPLLVNSGGGIHAYWPLTAEIPAASWQGLAKHWRAVLHLYKLHSDPARDMDVASVLRVPGTSNYKRGGKRAVQIVQEAEATDARSFLQWLQAQALKAKPVAKEARKVDLSAVPEWLRADDVDNADLVGHAGGPKASAVEATKHCGQLRLIAAVAGDVDEPLWRGMLGVVKHSTEGVDLAHEWSKGHPEYDADQTQDKFDRWSAGPTTCAYFQEHNAEGCEGCSHRGKVTSPIQLGYVVVEKQVIHMAVPTEEGSQVHEIELPSGYLWDSGRQFLCKQIKDKDGVVDNVPFCRSLLHAVTRIRQLDGMYEIRLRSHHLTGLREYTVPQGEVSLAGDAFIKALGGHEVFLYNNDSASKALMRGYLIDEIKRCERAGQETVMFNQFGWQDNGESFLLGTHLYRRNAAQTTDVIPSPSLKQHSEVGPVPNASVAEWSAAINSVYNLPGAEPLQYAIASSFGSPLTDLFGDDYHGAAVCLSGQKSGQGKTTACWAGLSVWGVPSQMMFSQREGATFNARIARHGKYKNLPVMHDELSQFTPDEAMQLLYAMANGRGRARLDQSGQVEREPMRWRMSGYLTTNRPVNELVSSARGGLMATVVRNYEINLDEYAIERVDLEVMRKARDAIEKNAGAAGAVYAQFIVAKRNEIKEVLRSMSDRIVERMPKLGNDTRFRLYRMHLEATLTGAVLARKLGLIGFDLARLFEWAMAHTEKLCTFAEEAEEDQNSTPVEKMISDLMPRTIITRDYRDTRSKEGPEQPLRIPNESPAARYVHGCPGMSAAGKWAEKKLIVTTSAIRTWAAENHTTKAQLIKAAMEGGYCKHGNAERFVITRGTPLPGGQSSCYVFDLSGSDAFKEVVEGENDVAG